ncbi:MAG: Hpt domain-containing protein [Rhodobacteraceae bacterium]|nr:Hpt domain-containing protein [Paracoccaceae bacterium]
MRKGIARPEFKSRITAIRNAFIAKLRFELDGIENAFQAAGGNSGGLPDLEEIEETAHRLFGVAGTVGLTDVGEELRRIEQWARDTRDANADAARAAAELGMRIAAVRQALCAAETASN